MLQKKLENLASFPHFFAQSLIFKQAHIFLSPVLQVLFLYFFQQSGALEI